MAISGVFSSFLVGRTATLAKSSSSSLPRLIAAPPTHSRVSMRTVTYAAASKLGTKTEKRDPRGIMKPRRASSEIQVFLGGVPETPRKNPVLKQIREYIKLYKLQDPQNKKIIICNGVLKKIFGGKERVGFVEIAGLINHHFK
ncbi:uncharacterized protein LOC132294135 [Cornus florida]|uniref:uncharacterized protein LOC132294135 n=1 Tax=Cornus florida TaxID=4283 RepID=UPI00289C63A5|nr:uncharacterized protein LOC132294135 [Cornus florida]XP_059647865.1 uncharacterized protein LOC132294135 [Cornus florida]XP_059647866.1 uncharacterized protein LOC132294135 [Cornus florida]XP_059647867.1 uncharacterized protein LOC132294135 [Cornus florida]